MPGIGLMPWMVPGQNPNVQALAELTGGDVGAGGPGDAYGQQAGAPAMTPQQRVWANAAAEAAQRKANIAARKAPMTMDQLPQNPFELAAWGQMVGAGARPAQGSAFRDYQDFGGMLDRLFNQGSTTVRGPNGQMITQAGSPYAQWQDAVTQQAPYKAQVDVARIEADAKLRDSESKRELARQLIDSLFGFNAAAPVGGGAGMRTDYGAGFSAPRRAMPVDLRRFRPVAAA